MTLFFSRGCRLHFDLGPFRDDDRFDPLLRDLVQVDQIQTAAKEEDRRKSVQGQWKSGLETGQKLAKIDKQTRKRSITCQSETVTKLTCTKKMAKLSQKLLLTK